MYRRVLKPGLDYLFALLLLLLFSPVFLLVAFSILFTMGRPVFFKQQRPGLHEKIFTIYKFRTMTDERDNDGHLLPDEMRLRGSGKLIRSLSLDELPQLLNVLKGEMSFIGPRPLLVEYLPLYNEQQRKRHDVKPGITGWAQVNGRNAISWEKKFEMDTWYCDNISFLLDMKILWMTVQKVLLKKDITTEGHASACRFEGKGQ